MTIVPETDSAVTRESGADAEFVAAVRRGGLELLVRSGERRARPPAAPLAELGQGQTPEGRGLLTAFFASRPLGLYVSGLPGTGKSTLLLHLILDDIQQGRACCLLDPHGDLVDAVLARCPTDADTLNRILVFDPGDTSHPVGLDLLAVKTERERELAVQFMVSLYEKLFLPDQQGPILHQSLGNGIRLLVEVGGSLAELPLLFSDEKLLRERLAQIRDPWVRHYFEHVWLRVSGSPKGEYLAYFTSKLSRFVDDPMLRNILGQKGAPDLGAHLNDRGVVLARLSAGAIGSVNARLLGMILLHKLEAITRGRESSEPAARPPLHVYLDEFHELVTGQLAEFLTCARKYNVGLHLAHQRFDTLSVRTREAILGTVGHWMLFRQAPGADMRELAGTLWPRFGERELASVPNFEALGRVVGGDGKAHVGRLRVPETGAAWEHVAWAVRALSRRQFSRVRSEVERELLERVGWQEPPVSV